MSTATPLGVIGEDGAAIPVTAERLGREKARRGEPGERPDTPAVAGPAEALRRIGDDAKPLGRGHGLDGAVVRRVAEEVHRDHRPRFQAQAARFVDRRGKALGVEQEIVVADVHEEGRGPEQGHGLRGRDKGERGHEDRLAGPDPKSHEREQQGIGPARASDGVQRTAKPGQSSFELRDLGTVDVLAVRKHPGDGLLKAVPDTALLRAEVDERDRHGAGHRSP